MTKRPFLVALLACLLPAAQNAAAKQYPQESPTADERESVAAPSPEAQENPSASPAADTSRPRTITESLPYTPYPAGLPWVITPQAFRVPIPDRIYYPPEHYVRRCPYYPRGYYWGANWRFNVIGRCNLLFCGTFRFNPYLTAAKAQHDPKLRGQRRYAMPPGPEGQARLLGVSTAPPRALPPTLAKDAKAERVGEAESQVAVEDDARDKPATTPTSSRRTAKKPVRDLH